MNPDTDKPTASGVKYSAPNGTRAIKDGIKPNPDRQRPSGRKPPWLRVKLARGARFRTVQQTVHDHALSTVCEESHCPNIGECWSHGTATIMLMGSVCTRACRFCAVDTGNPNGWLDAQEPANAAESVRLMNLRYVVLTSVDRDDLADGGATHYAACVQAIKRVNPGHRRRGVDARFLGVRTRGTHGCNVRSGRLRAESGNRSPSDPPGA